MAGGELEADYFVGPKAEQYRGLLKIRYPVEHGIVTNWDDMEKIWNYIYSEDLKARSDEVSSPFLPFVPPWIHLTSFSFLLPFFLFFFFFLFFIPFHVSSSFFSLL